MTAQKSNNGTSHDEACGCYLEVWDFPAWPPSHPTKAYKHVLSFCRHGYGEGGRTSPVFVFVSYTTVTCWTLTSWLRYASLLARHHNIRLSDRLPTAHELVLWSQLCYTVMSVVATVAIVNVCSEPTHSHPKISTSLTLASSLLSHFIL